MNIFLALGYKLLALALVPVAFAFAWEAVRIIRTPRWEWDEERRREAKFRTEQAHALRFLRSRL